MAGTLCLLIWPICHTIAHAAVPDATTRDAVPQTTPSLAMPRDATNSASADQGAVAPGPHARAPSGHDPDAAVAETSLTPHVVSFELPAGTALVVALDEPVASWTHKRGDTFALRLAAPLVVDGVEVVPAGTKGTGQVVHAAAARGGGAAGELLLAARTLEWNGRTIALRGFSVSVTGVHQPGATLGVAIVAGPFAMFVRGREIEIPAGTRGTAKLAAALAIAPGERSASPAELAPTPSSGVTAATAAVTTPPSPPSAGTSDAQDAGVAESESDSVPNLE